jgi:hypothetical protein
VSGERPSTIAVVGVGAAACAACCAAPVLGLLAGITVLGIVGTVFFGIAAAVVAVLAAAAVLVRRRRRRHRIRPSAAVP